MVLELIFGFIILAIAVFIAVRILGNVAVGIALIALVILASYLLLGSFPSLKTIPLIGDYLPKFLKTTGDAVGVMKNVEYSIDILSTGRDSENNLLIVVINSGEVAVSGFEVFVDNQATAIINFPEDLLPSGKSTVIQTDWKEGFGSILVRTSQISANY